MPTPRKGHPRLLYAPGDDARVRAMAADGWTYRQAAEAFGCSTRLVETYVAAHRIRWRPGGGVPDAGKRAVALRVVAAGGGSAEVAAALKVTRRRAQYLLKALVRAGALVKAGRGWAAWGG